MAWPLLFVSALYLLVIFPLAYFRHDDWLILGNAALQLPKDWGFALRPTLFYAENEVIWFFRPFFKLGVLAWYQIFGYRYYLWLASLFLMVFAAVCLGSMTLRLLSGSRQRGTFFAILFCTSVYFHFGSLVWMGEGMMNCPQLFLLALATYLFCLSAESPRRITYSGVFAFLCFAASLGFKESGVFHVALLWAIIWCEKHYSALSFREKATRIFPYAFLAGVYLVIRFGMPMNPAYAPHMQWKFFIRPAMILFAGPAAIMAFSFLFLPDRQQGRKLLFSVIGKRITYILFLLIGIAPYFGHGFFSVGWLLLPGFYFAFIFSLLHPSLSLTLPAKTFNRIGASLLLVSLSVIFWRINEVGWWQWHRPQKQIETIIAATDASGVKRAFILNCQSPRYPKVSLNEVVGFEAGFYFLWAMHQPTKVHFSVVACDAREKTPELFAKEDTDLILRWEFPEFTIVKSAGSDYARTTPAVLTASAP